MNSFLLIFRLLKFICDKIYGVFNVLRGLIIIFVGILRVNLYKNIFSFNQLEKRKKKVFPQRKMNDLLQPKQKEEILIRFLS